VVSGIPPDDLLVRRAAAGDHGAFTELVRRHEGRVFAVAMRMLGREEDALDATQDALLTVYRKAGQFRGESAFTTWLHRITVNACYDILRRRARQPALHLATEDGPEREPGPPVDDHAGAVAGTIDAERALAEVPDDFRAVLILADVHDLPYDEIAAILEIPVGTVKSRVHRGRLALARAMGLEPARGAPAREPAGRSEPSEGRS
jgi:RNA polymerase sigma-70 factor (ECF subfamily)